MMRRFAALVLLAPLLGACVMATKPVAPNQAIAVPAERVMWQNATSGYTIKVTRDAGLVGGACPTRIYIDGKNAADLRPAETVTFVVAEGRHILGGGPSPDAGGLCSGFKSSERYRRETDASGKQGDSLSFRFSLSAYGEPSLTPTAF